MYSDSAAQSWNSNAAADLNFTVADVDIMPEEKDDDDDDDDEHV